MEATLKIKGVDYNMAHKYKLKVKWSKRAEWDINILAINAEVITMWLPKQENEDDYIVSVHIELLEKNVEKVKNTFLAKGIDKCNAIQNLIV
jgi:hypothetical protein